MSKTKTIRIDRLLEPERAARSAIDDEQLQSLVASIRDLGVLEPLIVRPDENGTFTVIAGHRRLLAARQAGLAELPCLIETDAERADAIRIHENVEREELSPTDEGRYYQELYGRLGEDLDQVAARVRKSRDYVERRLLLVRGDSEVFQALDAHRISFGVAEEMNRIEDSEQRSYYLDYASRTGCSVRQAREWRVAANARAAALAREKAEAGARGGDEPRPEPAPPPGPNPYSMVAPHELSSAETERACLFCGSPHPEFRMILKFLCQGCFLEWQSKRREDQR